MIRSMSLVFKEGVCHLNRDLIAPYPATLLTFQLSI